MTEEEKKQKVIETYGNFPLRINFLLGRKDGKNHILFNKFKNNAIKLENIKHRSLTVFSFGHDAIATLGVKQMDSYDELQEELDRLAELWSDESEDSA